jgi:thioesterase domain-containing protein/acyl carrier protein
MPLSSNGKTDRKALTCARYDKADKRAARPAHVAPGTPMELALAGIWQALLKQPQIGAHDDFFECGGQSIDAVRCVARVQEAVGKSISLGDMWAHRTLADLAAFITQLDDQIDRGHLQLLGASAAGKAGRPYFMVHPAGGHCVGYHELATMLSRPCHGFSVQPQDVAGRQLRSIEAIASRYLEELVRAQPTGPYTLVGWSSGGCIAFEMAAQIGRTGLGGGQVERVILIDCPAPRVHTPVDACTKLRWFFEDLNLGLPIEALSDELLAELAPEERFSQAVALMNQRVQGALDEGQLRHIFQVFDAIVDAVLRYRPRPIESALLVLRAKEGVVSEFAAHPHAHDPDWGWRGLTSGDVGWDWIEGSHHTVLRQPGVQAIARWLTSALPSAHASASTETEGMTSA